ncbi:T cell receptor alpha chain MC.7.G5-like [Pelmatolapia mariae]|uniref:T cell receptor alpha chain MC.7.G5-like n=1 Tax=Pelmatolapia mariae TaxID=158779 RepID=UPI003211F0C5
MLSLHYWLMFPLFLITLTECKGEDKVIQEQGDVIAAEGDTVTLGCQYESSGTNNYLFWYKQDGNNSPKFILMRYSKDQGNTADEFKERFSSTLDSSIRSVTLKIQKLQLSDSAVYYCALQPTCYCVNNYGNKLVFGSGSKLIVQSGVEYEPSYFKLGKGDDAACLATGFSRHNATANHWNYSLEFSKTKAVAISPKLDLYNQVIFTGNDAKICESPGKRASACVDVLEPDPKVNLMSLTILALRVIFIKTIIFNIIMTLRLWISQ